MSESKSYRALNEELDEIIERLQSSDLDVDQIIYEYQKGIEVIDELQKYLKLARNKITKLAPTSLKSKK